VSHLEPNDRFDIEWPHVLERELDRIPLPPRARPRYLPLRRRPRALWRMPARPAFAAAVLVAVVTVASVVLSTSGRLPVRSDPGLLQGATGVQQQQQNGALHPATDAPVQASLAPIVPPPLSYSYAWSGAPAAPQAWTPDAVDDWDLLASSDFPSDQGGTMQARYGADCAPPPATHPIRALADSAYLCRGQLMTAINGGGDAPKTYGGVYLAPAQLADFGAGTATITWQVSTRRASTNDWWEVWLTPFEQNLVAPAVPDDVPAFNGPPGDAIRVRMNNGICPGSGQPATLGTSGGVPIGTVFNVEVFANHKRMGIDGPGFPPCVETALGRSGPSVPSGFRLDVARNHVKFSALRAGGGQPIVYADARVDLPFTQAVLQFAHQSFAPAQACGGNGTCGPNTYQWSNVSIKPAAPFTMLRPNGAATVHGQTTTLTLPQPAPADSHLRFYAIGSIRVGFDGHPAAAAVAQAGQQSRSGEASYWMPVPAGTTTVTLSGTGANGLPWWVFDVSVWAPTQ
jgi:hypothetical protein